MILWSYWVAHWQQQLLRRHSIVSIVQGGGISSVPHLPFWELRDWMNEWPHLCGVAEIQVSTCRICLSSGFNFYRGWSIEIYHKQRYRKRYVENKASTCVHKVESETTTRTYISQIQNTFHITIVGIRRQHLKLTVRTLPADIHVVCAGGTHIA